MELLILCHSLPVQVRLPERFFDPSHGFQTRNIALDVATCAVCLVAVGLDKCNGVVFDASGKMPYVYVTTKLCALYRIFTYWRSSALDIGVIEGKFGNDEKRLVTTYVFIRLPRFRPS